MLVKILGTLDLLIAFSLLLYLRQGAFKIILIILLIFLIIKAVLTIKDLFSVVDIFASIIIIIELIGVSSILSWFAFGWLLLKGLYTLVSSV